MKTAISIPDDIFSAADQFAQRSGLSRSELYTTAIVAYLKDHSRQSVTERLDEVYADEEAAVSSQLDPVHQALQLQSIAQKDW